MNSVRLVLQPAIAFQKENFCLMMIKNINKEKILCVKRSLLPEEWVGQKNIVKLEENIFYNTLSKAEFQWIDRNFAETDPSFKQIIPYIILQTKNEEKTAIYKRHGTEKRLHDLWSCGIGGHINPQDSFSESASLKKILLAGMRRELDEELIQRPENQIPVFSGVINEETTEVGSVHMGVVFRLITETPDQFFSGDELEDFQWKNTATLDSLNMELWSNLALELISSIYKPSSSYKPGFSYKPGSSKY